MAVSRDYLPITPDDLKLGEPAPFDCYGESKMVMLKAGTIVSSIHLEKLLDSGYKIDTTPPEVISDKTPFDIFDELKNRAQKIFLDFLSQDKTPSIPERITKFCQDIQKLCEFDSCAALGAIHLNYGGRHTVNHPIHVAIICEMIGQSKNVPQEQRLSILAAAITCNIGMLKLQDTLHKQETPPTQEQKDAIRMHPSRSVAMLMENNVTDELWLNTVQYHHEKVNGKGYPGELSGEQIPLPVRILALADVYCSLVTSRNYRGAVLAQEALRILLLKRSNEIDVPLTQSFIKKICVFPPGSFVKLQNGEKALVIRRGASPTTPIVKSIISADGVPYRDNPVKRDCADKAYAIKEMIPREKTPLSKLELLWDYKR